VRPRQSATVAEGKVTKSRHGGTDRVSTKAKLAEELRILGEVLVRARERAGLKQSVVAARLGLPASYLSKIENGTRRLDVIELIQIAEAMGSDPGDIVRELVRSLSGSLS
jgi:ribosome-binding protein aMBF1 (putative translation factor)